MKIKYPIKYLNNSTHKYIGKQEVSIINSSISILFF